MVNKNVITVTLFLDLRDNYGITQCIIEKENKFLKDLEKIQLETVIKIVGKVSLRSTTLLIMKLELENKLK